MRFLSIFLHASSKSTNEQFVYSIIVSHVIPSLISRPPPHIHRIWSPSQVELKIPWNSHETSSVHSSNSFQTASKQPQNIFDIPLEHLSNTHRTSLEHPYNTLRNPGDTLITLLFSLLQSKQNYYWQTDTHTRTDGLIDRVNEKYQNKIVFSLKFSWLYVW